MTLCETIFIKDRTVSTRWGFSELSLTQGYFNLKKAALEAIFIHKSFLMQHQKNGPLLSYLLTYSTNI